MDISKKNSSKPRNKLSSKKKSQFQMDENKCKINFKNVTQCLSASYKPADIEILANNCGLDPSITTKAERCRQLMKIKKHQTEDNKKEEKKEEKKKRRKKKKRKKKKRRKKKTLNPINLIVK